MQECLMLTSEILAPQTTHPHLRVWKHQMPHSNKMVQNKLSFLVLIHIGLGERVVITSPLRTLGMSLQVCVNHAGVSRDQFKKFVVRKKNYFLKI